MLLGQTTGEQFYTHLCCAANRLNVLLQLCWQCVTYIADALVYSAMM